MKFSDDISNEIPYETCINGFFKCKKTNGMAPFCSAFYRTTITECVKTHSVLWGRIICRRNTTNAAYRRSPDVGACCSRRVVNLAEQWCYAGQTCRRLGDISPHCSYNTVIVEWRIITGYYYLRRGGFVFTSVCLSVWLSDCKQKLLKNHWSNLYEIISRYDWT